MNYISVMTGMARNYEFVKKLKKFCTVVFEVLFFVSGPVYSLNVNSRKMVVKKFN